MNQDKIWDFFQNDKAIGRSVFHADVRHKFLANQIGSGSKVLNIGVGSAGLEALLIAKNVKVYSLDPSVETIESLRRDYDLGDRARVGYCQDIPFDDNFFDFVVMSEVLEHLANDVLEETVQECYRVLRVGGVFIGTVPADEALVDGMTVCPCCGTIFHRWGHVQEFTDERLKSVLNLQFSQCTIERKYFGNWMGLNWKGMIAHLARRILLLLGVRGSSENFYFIAQKSIPPT